MTDYEKSRIAEYEKELEKIRTKLADAERNYQFCGTASAMRTVRKYEKLEDVYSLALQALSNECKECSCMKRSAKAMFSKYKRAEVENDDSVLTFKNVQNDLLDITLEAGLTL